MGCIMPGFPVHHQFPELTQTQVHWVSGCHATISSSIDPFSSHLQSFPASGSFPMSQFFSSGGQSIGVSASGSVFPMNIWEWFPLWLTGWSSLKSKGLSSLLQHHSSKASVLWCTAFFIVQLSHPYMTTGKTIALTRWNFVCKVMSLLLNILSRLVIAFLPRNKHLLISWLQSPSTVIGEPLKNKVSHCFHCFPIYLPWSDGTSWSDEVMEDHDIVQETGIEIIPTPQKKEMQKSKTAVWGGLTSSCE